MPALADGVTTDTPILLRNRVAGVSDAVGDDEKYRVDVAQRPTSASLTDYERVPVDQFGEALLRGMGWSEGCPIGLTNAAVIQPTEYIRRGDLLGLGADPSIQALNLPSMTNKKRARARPEQQFDPVDGRVRHVKGIDERLATAADLAVAVGSDVVITSGAHQGQTGIVTMLSSTTATVRLDVSESIVQVRPEDVRRATGRDREQQERPAAAMKRPREIRWVVPGLRLRVVDKRHRMYNRKGRVLDVPTATSFTMVVDDGNVLVEDLSERDVETLVPEAQGAFPMMVVAGRHRGRTGRLLERRTDKDYARVRLDATDALACDDVKVKLDYVSEFVPDDGK
ncbi:hypothetical protein PBRA_006622 [Plasmodiophora brassicae]|uniref:G-patch domain-containing protein n=2 Tax=Plasmodiophora brassicae TaxID=37360 RepID=A0A0G4IT29_PLABS|nr:hypothetical protein PBRA_006622 [Plasmodiophora brassicae]